MISAWFPVFQYRKTTTRVNNNANPMAKPLISRIGPLNVARTDPNSARLVIGIGGITPEKGGTDLLASVTLYWVSSRLPTSYYADFCFRTHTSRSVFRSRYFLTVLSDQVPAITASVLMTDPDPKDAQRLSHDPSSLRPTASRRIVHGCACPQVSLSGL